MNYLKNSAFVAMAVIGLASCKKDKKEDTVPQYDVPKSYNFENVDYAEATVAVNMATGLQTYLGKATTRQLSQDTVNYIWNNTNNGFTTEFAVNLPNTAAQLNAATTIKLSALAAEPTVIKAYADEMVKVSKSIGVTAVQGVAGKLSANRIVSATGLEYNQLVVKGLMGFFQMKQVFEHLDKSTTADNKTVVAGKGTAMQHEWDLAFGYVSLPKQYDSAAVYSGTDLTRPLGIGGYFKERARPIAAGGNVFSAFLKGRAAIGANDYKGRDAAIATIKEYLEKTLAISAYAYLNLSKTRGSDNPARFHDYSEGYGFTIALKQRIASSKLSATNYQRLNDILKMDYWELQKTENAAKVDEAIAIIKTTYGF
uniref:DUF4856 domain-containing protein n=1 Tax=Pedobacter schmidteae TaxID=2201271 RepID=UPI0013CE98CF|nr:DUF4856 domain-containing protein [Pedobacter schmidteae]